MLFLPLAPPTAIDQMKPRKQVIALVCCVVKQVLRPFQGSRMCYKTGQYSLEYNGQTSCGNHDGVLAYARIVVPCSPLLRHYVLSHDLDMLTVKGYNDEAASP